MLESPGGVALSGSRRVYPDCVAMKPVDYPLTEFQRFHTDDVDEARRELGRLLSPHTLRPTRRSARLDMRCHAVSLGETSLIYTQYGTAVRLDPGALETFYLVGMPISGASTIRGGGREVVSRPGIASVQSCRHAMVAEWDDECRKLSIKIDRSALERRLATLLGRAPTRPIEFDPLLDLNRGGGVSWNRLIAFLLTELSPTSIYLSSPLARRMLDDALISTLLLVQPHNYTKALQVDTGALMPPYLRRAEEMIAADPSLPGGLAGLASSVGVSVRSLQAGFRRHRDTTPVEFIRAQRLARAHDALRSAGPGMRVTDVALAVGYSHLGRFALDYRARYGESPSATLSRSRGGNVGGSG